MKGPSKARLIQHPNMLQIEFELRYLHQIGGLLATEHRMRIEVISTLVFDIGFNYEEADRFFKKRIFVGVDIGIGSRVGILFPNIRFPKGLLLTRAFLLSISFRSMRKRQSSIFFCSVLDILR